MAAKRKKSVFPIVIKTRRQLEKIFEIFDAEFLPGAEGFLSAIKELAKPLTPTLALERWLNRNRISVCSTGERKLLASCGTIHSWKAYCRKHWNDDDGAFDWFHMQRRAIMNNSHVNFFKPLFYEQLYPGARMSFAEFLKANPGIEWAEWPFKGVKPQVKKRKKR